MVPRAPQVHFLVGNCCRIQIRRTMDRTGQRDAAADLWKHTLSQIPTLLGRIFYLASLRDPNTGHYEHHGLAAIYSDEDAHETLALSHLHIFSEWLRFPLEMQKADLDLYLSSLAEVRRSVLTAWVQLMPYRNVIPANAPLADRELFLADLDALISVLKNEYGVVSQDPDA